MSDMRLHYAKEKIERLENENKRLKDELKSIRKILDLDLTSLQTDITRLIKLEEELKNKDGKLWDEVTK